MSTSTTGVVTPAFFTDIADQDLITHWGFVVEGFRCAQERLTKTVEDAYGIPYLWFEILLRLVRSPDSRLPMSRLAHDVALSSGGVTKLVDRMITAGLIVRDSCPTDRRVVYAALSEEGRQLAERIQRTHAEDLRAVLGQRFTSEELLQLGSFMNRLRVEAVPE